MDGITVTTLESRLGYADGPLAHAQFNMRRMVRLRSGDMLVVDMGNCRLRRISKDGLHVTTVAGEGTAGRRDGPAPTAQLSCCPTAVYCWRMLSTTASAYSARISRR